MKPPRVSTYLVCAVCISVIKATSGNADEVKLIASDGALSDVFGGSVAVSNDTAVVGARFADNGQANSNRGAAYVFVRTGCAWTQRAKLIASDAAASDSFGTAVAISGDTIVVGSISSNGPVLDQGAAYVFVRPAGGWTGTMTQTARLIASDGAANDGFGSSVGIDGNTVVVGASGDDGAFVDQGSAYVFTKPGAGWANMTQDAKLTVSDPATTDVMGNAVAILGGTIAVGVDRDDVTFEDQGSVLVFVRPGAIWGDMTQTAKLTASDAAILDALGVGLSISDNTLVAGARFQNSSRGAAYVFVKPAGGWTNMTHSAKLTASDAAAGDAFGFAVSISGNTIAVGASSDDGLAGSNQGAVYKFLMPGGGWSGALNESQKITASDAAANDVFGISVALSGQSLLIGASSDDVCFVDQGSVYLNHGDDNDLDGVPDCNDVCPSTPAGLTVDLQGRPRADLNNDCLVNGADIPLIVDQLLNS